MVSDCDKVTAIFPACQDTDMAVQQLSSCDAAELPCDDPMSQPFSCQDSDQLQTATVLPVSSNSDTLPPFDPGIVHSAATDCAMQRHEKDAANIRQMYIQKMLDVSEEMVKIYETLDAATAVSADGLMNGVFDSLECVTSDSILVDVTTDQLHKLCCDVMLSYKAMLTATVDGARHSCQPQPHVCDDAQGQSTLQQQSDSDSLLDTCQINAIPPSKINQFQPIIIASMVIEGKYLCNFEIDTDASHTVISPEVYQKACLVAPQPPPKGKLHAMKLADGTYTSKKSFDTFLHLARADKPEDSQPFQVMVLEGPSVILGRTAIKYFWPQIYDNLVAAAERTRVAAQEIPSYPKKVLDDMWIAALKNDPSQFTAMPNPTTAVPRPSVPASSDDITSDATRRQVEGEQQCSQICQK